jgi:multimeric flavodoxin WrbA
MKVLLINGSPNKNGCTNEALKEIASTLESDGISTEIFWIGNKPISGCLGCSACFKTKRCIINDKVNEFLDKAEEADGFIFGTPVHYAGPSGFITSFMDRAFYGKPNLYKGKPAACITSCRRAGGVPAFDRLNKYFTYSCMPIVSSNYWNGVFGKTKEEVRQDYEGMQTMRILAHNMSWLLKCIELGKENNINFPEMEKKVFTNFHN